MKNLQINIAPKLHLKFEVKDLKGNTTHYHEEEGHSWTRNGWNMFLGMICEAGGTNASTYDAGYINCKNIGGSVSGASGSCVNRSEITLPATTGVGYCNTATTASKGIVIGTGNTAFSINNYALATAIAAGTSSGQMVHNAMSAPTVSYTSGTKTWDTVHSRVFNNNSGALITVKETGLVWSGYAFGGTPQDLLVARDVLGTPVDVAYGSLINVTYTISMDFSTPDA